MELVVAFLLLFPLILLAFVETTKQQKMAVFYQDQCTELNSISYHWLGRATDWMDYAKELERMCMKNSIPLPDRAETIREKYRNSVEAA